MYVSAGKKGRKRDRPSRSRGLSTRGRGTYDEDKPPVFVLVDRGTGQRYAVPAKTADESTIRLLLASRQQESLTVYTDGFRAYDPFEEDATFDRECVIHLDVEGELCRMNPKNGTTTGHRYCTRLPRLERVTDHARDDLRSQ